MLASTLLMSLGPKPVTVLLCLGRVKVGPTGPLRSESGALVEGLRSLGEGFAAAIALFFLDRWMWSRRQFGKREDSGVEEGKDGGGRGKATTGEAKTRGRGVAGSREAEDEAGTVKLIKLGGLHTYCRRATSSRSCLREAVYAPCSPLASNGWSGDQDHKASLLYSGLSTMGSISRCGTYPPDGSDYAAFANGNGGDKHGKDD